MTIDVIEDPPDDERSPEEKACCDAVMRVLNMPCKAIFIGDNGAEAGAQRTTYVAVWLNWLGKRRFRKRQRACVEAVRAIVGPVGVVTVELVPEEVLRQANAK